MQLDLAVGVSSDFPKVHGAGGLRRLAVAGIGDVEFRALDGSARHAVLLIDGQFRGFTVPKRQCFFISCVQRDRLHPVGVPVREEVGGGDGLLRDPVRAGVHPESNLAVRSSGPVILIIAVDGLYSERSTGNRLLRVGVDFGNGQQGLFAVLEGQRFVVVGVQADCLNTVRFILGQTVRLRDILLGDPVAAGVHLDGHGAVRSGGHVMPVVAVDALHSKFRTRDGLVSTLLHLGDSQIGPFVILHPQLGGLAGGQLHMVLRRVQDVVRQNRRFCIFGALFLFHAS